VFQKFYETNLTMFKFLLYFKLILFMFFYYFLNFFKKYIEIVFGCEARFKKFLKKNLLQSYFFKKKYTVIVSGCDARDP